MATSPVKDFLVTYLMPQKCYEEFFLNFHLHVPCLKFVLNKAAGFWIILDTFLAQLPQLMKILWGGSAEGLSLTAFLLQLYAFSCPVVYAMANNFPLFAWADRLFTLAPTAAIVFLILHYRGDTIQGILLLFSFSGIMLLLRSYAAAAVISAIQASSLAALIASKALQLATNYRNGHTGQLSILSVILSFAGSLAVAFVSLQEAGNYPVSLSHILSACLSCVLLAQVLSSKTSTISTTKKTE
ncbi:mannose-P-dolichol utilization defect 1 protein-like [Archocentrus centrarchus]|uniref:mannose-P-dolichol utilization defect 1 protein-like n=1 Tax=Archocentrus centrarchus TaxID=63155 RepID=UPI0011EA0710|nr:mannose-P-dolichol utilization defect 1 protein-like [Archocentrus centrarchus]XP_030602686.1 mannose-P-dolichol utilization defect 1 protein-like [Archocentrus centrarchus]